MAGPSENTAAMPMPMTSQTYVSRFMPSFESTHNLSPTSPTSPSHTMASNSANVHAIIKIRRSQHSSRTFGRPPLTPNPTPPDNTVADSFGDVQNVHNEQAARQHIRRLASGHNITEDFVPNWRYPQPATIDVNSGEDLQAAHILMALHKAESEKRIRPPPSPNSNDFSRATTGHISFSHDSTLSDTEDESEASNHFSLQSRLEKSDTTVSQPRHAPNDQPAMFSFFVNSYGEIAGSKPVRQRDKQPSFSSVTNLRKRKGGPTSTGEGEAKSAGDEERIKKKSKGTTTTKRTTTKQKAGAASKRNGEGKKKNLQELKLGEIKHWLNSKTQKCLPRKKPGDPVTPDHRSDYKALDFTRLPDLGPHMCNVEQLDEKLYPKGKYDGGDPTNLHEGELALAESIDMSYDQYRCQKRRIFAARAVYHRFRHNHPELAVNLSTSWGKSQTQLVGSIDANKSSKLWNAFEKWKWFDTMEEKWDKEYLERITNDFESHDKKQPWSKGKEPGRL